MTTINRFNILMKITAIKLDNIRGFKNLPKTSFSETINVLAGPNNAGKSTILKSIYSLQVHQLGNNDVTIGQTNGTIKLYFSGSHQDIIQSNGQYSHFEINPLNGSKTIQTLTGGANSFGGIPNHEPNNLIYPYLSKRKVGGYDSTINENNANSVNGNFAYLYSKIDRLVTPQFQPGNSIYLKACEEILGFEISSLAKGGGKEAVQFIHNLEHIPLTAMGEGVVNILGLVCDLSVAENKIFLIEEPENDIHPKALKALMNLIIEKSSSNQFFVSTHSNIVMKYLGSANHSKVFSVTNFNCDIDKPNMRLSSLEEISESPEQRKKLLEDLGYDFFDYDLWKAWLFLEESSAEVLIREHLIRWFTPELQVTLRTFSAGSTSSVKVKFDDFNKLFVFLHLEPTYKNKVWVYIDSGENENKIIDELKAKYVQSGWSASNFNQFSQHDFERYYPEQFKKRVDEVLSIIDKQKKRIEKKILLDEVKHWIKENDDEAKEAFGKSAKEIITVLESISKELNKSA